MKLSDIVKLIEENGPKIAAVEKEIVALAKAGKSLYPKLLEHTTLESKVAELKQLLPAAQAASAQIAEGVKQPFEPATTDTTDTETAPKPE